MGKKEKMMQKYIEKKKKQLHRDELLREISKLSSTQNCGTNICLVKNRVKKRRKVKKEDETFESNIFKKSEEESMSKSDKEDNNKIGNDENECLSNITNSNETNINNKGTNNDIETVSKENEAYSDDYDTEDSDANNSIVSVNEIINQDTFDKNKIFCNQAEDMELSISYNVNEPLSDKKIIDDKLINEIDDKLINEIDDKLINEIDDKLINEIDDKLINRKNTNQDDLSNYDINETVYYEKLRDEKFISRTITNREEEVKRIRRTFAIFYEESDIISTIKSSLITFIEGNTGCGKTTQIPQFLYEHGFCEKGMIGITQPRRVAAISVCARINKEMNGSYCGYRIRYDNNVCESNVMQIMTEGVLLREIEKDFLLEKYSVVIIDEVHERTINCDLLCGFLSKIVEIRYKKGNILRLILMSATANEGEYAKIFRNYKTIRLEGKQYDVNVFYELKTPENYIEVAFKRIKSILNNQGSSSKYDCNGTTNKIIKGQYGNNQGYSNKYNCKDAIQKCGNNQYINSWHLVNDKDAAILVFLPGKEEIYKLKHMLEKNEKDDNIVVLPLHSGLSREEQNLVYAKYDKRKIILATNIAETSITIEDVTFVVDSGKAKYCIKDGECVKYYIGNISKSSAIQRMGRAGRVRPGVCYRIYSSETYSSFLEHNRPEILCEPLDGMLLNLKAAGIKNIFAFPFITPVDKTAVLGAIELLQEIGALNDDGNLTILGTKIAMYNIPPSFAYILCLKSNPNIFYYLAVIASILTLGFEVPKNEKTKKYFINQKSDIIVYLKIFLAYKKAHSKRQFARDHGLTINSLKEVSKQTKYLVKINYRYMNNNMKDIISMNSSKDITNINNTTNIPEINLDKLKDANTLNTQGTTNNVSISERELNTLNTIETTVVPELNEEIEDEIARILYYSFGRHLAIFAGNVWLYKGHDLSVSKNSVEIESNDFVFTHIHCGSNKEYAKGITIINPKWFSI